jgi:hypothetical protein
MSPTLAPPGELGRGLAVRCDDDTLAAVETALAALQRDGEIRRLFEQRGLTYTEPRTR